MPIFITVITSVLVIYVVVLAVLIFKHDRRGFDTEKIREIQNIYRILYQKNYNTSQASEKIEADMEATKERDQILLFIKNSQRGIMKGYTGS